MPESPSTSSQHRQQAARRLERSRRSMQSPEGRRTPAPGAIQFTAPLTPSQMAARYGAPAPPPQFNHVAPVSVCVKSFAL